jgi:hypothetical protein
MKKMIVFVLALLVAGTIFGAEKYLLPIGSNVNNHTAKVDMFVGGSWNSASFSYTPAMGNLQTLVTSRLQELADSFTPISGLEREEYGISVWVNPGPNATVWFVPQFAEGKWIVPPEVLNVKLNYGAGIGWVIDGVRLIELDVEDATGVHHFSSDDINGYSTACFFGVQNNALKQNAAVVLKEYAVPEFQVEIGLKWGKLTLWTDDGYGVFNVLDGSSIDISSPAPRGFEQYKAQHTTPVLVVGGPKITRVARVGNLTEITISGDAGTTAFVEFAESVGGKWNAIPSYPSPLKLQANTTTISHATEASACFYRARIAEAEPQSQR